MDDSAVWSMHLMRGIGGNKPFMLMEQTPNQQNWFPFCKVKRPGEVSACIWLSALIWRCCYFRLVCVWG